MNFGTLNSDSVKSIYKALGNEFVQAVIDNNTDKILNILENVHDIINYVDYDGNTALMVACEKGDVGLTRFLLFIPGIDVNLKNNFFETALIIACEKGHVDIVNELLKNKETDINLCNKWMDSPLIISILKGFNNVTELLLLCPGIDFNKKNNTDYTALQAACEHGNTYIVKKLLDIPGIVCHVRFHVKKWDCTEDERLSNDVAECLKKHLVKALSFLPIYNDVMRFILNFI